MKITKMPNLKDVPEFLLHLTKVYQTGKSSKSHGAVVDSRFFSNDAPLQQTVYIKLTKRNNASFWQHFRKLFQSTVHLLRVHHGASMPAEQIVH